MLVSLVSPGITSRSEAVPEGPRSFFNINYVTKTKIKKSGLKRVLLRNAAFRYASRYENRIPEVL